MAIKKQKGGRLSKTVEVERVKREDSVERQASNYQEAKNGGSIIVDSARLQLPKGFVEEEEKETLFGFDRVVLVILCLALAFISAIAYLIWNGWKPPE